MVDVWRPTSLDEALRILDTEPAAVPLAGGTDLMVEVNTAHHRPPVVVALRRVPELRERTDRWIGAGVTFERLIDAAEPALAQLSRTVGSAQIRAVATVGGNLGTASPAGDSLPFLAALDAHVVLASVTGQRRLAWDAFLLGPKHTARRPGELLLGVELPEDPPPVQAFAKVGRRSAVTVALVNVCVTRSADGVARIALGAVGPTVLRARKAEELLAAERHVTPGLLAEVERLVADEVRPIDDQRASAAYRRRAAGVLARRALERCLSP